MRAWADDGRASLVEILTPNGSRSGGVALLRPSRSALRRSKLDHGHGQAIGARMHGSAPWKTEETIVGWPRLLVLTVLLRFKIFEACADFLTPDGLGSCRKRRNFGAHRPLVQSCGCGSAALGSPDLVAVTFGCPKKTPVPFSAPFVKSRIFLDFASLLWIRP